MAQSVLVLGAGMVGTCSALHLQQRGVDVLLIDRHTLGQDFPHATSYGNAGLIQSEAVEPYAFPRSPAVILNAVFGRSNQIAWHTRGVWQMAGSLLSYYRHSHPTAHARATAAYSQLINHAAAEHAALIAAVGTLPGGADVEKLIARAGFRTVFRSPKVFAAEAQHASDLHQQYGVKSRVESADELAQAEPALAPSATRLSLSGAIHWLDPWAVSDPGRLLQHYLALFVARGGRVVRGDAASLAQIGKAWSVATDSGRVDAQHALLALGPWADGVIRQFGYHYPLFIKRGYHQHYRPPVSLRQPVFDLEGGYVLAPMKKGLRLTTGAEIAPLDAKPTPIQLHKTERQARKLLDLGESVPEPPWLGARPCTADMLPVMGAAPRHVGLWFNFGHGHQGFTLGPVVGRMLADMMVGEGTNAAENLEGNASGNSARAVKISACAAATTAHIVPTRLIDPAPYLPTRWE